MHPAHNPSDNFWTERRSGGCPSNDFRTPWHRDFGRVIHSASFRRLQGKTQLLGVDNGDFHRTRLTHSLEVSQIGISITKILKKIIECDSNVAQAKKWLPHPFLIQAICLAHDLGHPPFGHGGEVALNRCMLQYGGFEGNGQTLRVITRLEKYVDECGMDLTRRAILGTIKYPARYKDLVNRDLYPHCEPEESIRNVTGKHNNIKPPDGSVFVAKRYKPPKCYLDSEHEDIVLAWMKKGLEEDWQTFSKVCCTSENGEPRHKETIHKSLDASIMNLADDIAYGVHDLEDAIALKLIDKRTFNERFECFARKKNLKAIKTKCLDGETSTLANKLFGATHIRKQTISQIVGFFVKSVKIIPISSCQLGCPLLYYRAKLEDESKDALKELHGIVEEHVIKRPEVQQLEFRGQKIVTELFAAFATDPKRLMDERFYKESIQGRGDTEAARAVCDYIAGMTDDYAITRYRHLFVPRAGSVFDRL